MKHILGLFLAIAVSAPVMSQADTFHRVRDNLESIAYHADAIIDHGAEVALDTLGLGHDTLVNMRATGQCTYRKLRSDRPDQSVVCLLRGTNDQVYLLVDFGGDVILGAGHIGFHAFAITGEVLALPADFIADTFYAIGDRLPDGSLGQGVFYVVADLSAITADGIRIVAYGAGAIVLGVARIAHNGLHLLARGVHHLIARAIRGIFSEGGRPIDFITFAPFAVVASNKYRPSSEKGRFRLTYRGAADYETVASWADKRVRNICGHSRVKRIVISDQLCRGEGKSQRCATKIYTECVR